MGYVKNKYYVFSLKNVSRKKWLQSLYFLIWTVMLLFVIFAVNCKDSYCSHNWGKTIETFAESPVDMSGEWPLTGSEGHKSGDCAFTCGEYPYGGGCWPPSIYGGFDKCFLVGSKPIPGSTLTLNLEDISVSEAPDGQLTIDISYSGTLTTGSVRGVATSGDDTKTCGDDNVSFASSFHEYSVSGSVNWVWEDDIQRWRIYSWDFYGALIEESLECFFWDYKSIRARAYTDGGPASLGTKSSLDNAVPFTLNFNINSDSGSIKNTCGEENVDFTNCLPWGWAGLEFAVGINFLDLPKGIINGQLKSRGTILTIENADDKLDDNDIHEANVILWKQNGFVRGQISGETDKEYKEFLEHQKNGVFERIKIGPKDLGRFSFEDVPLHELVTIGGKKNFRPAYYIIEVIDAESEEINSETVVNGDFAGAEKNTVYFAAFIDGNNRPWQEKAGEFTEIVIELNPFDGIGVKEELIKSLSIKKVKGKEGGTDYASPNNYKPIEDEAQAYINTLKANSDLMTPETMEGLKRSIWAERVVRYGAIDSSKLLDISLKGLGTLLADVFDDLVNFAKDGKSKVEKQMNDVKNMSDKYPKGLFNADPTKPSLQKELGDHLRHLSSLNKAADKTKSMTQAFKGLSAVLAKLLNAAGMDADEAESIAGNINKVLNTLLRGVRSAFLGGSLKSSVGGATQGLIKLAIEEGVQLAKPLAYDDVVLPSYTKQTSPFLQNSVDEFKAWDTFDVSGYVSDRTKVVGEMNKLSITTKAVIDRATTAQLTAGALDVAQDVIELLGKAVKWAEVVAKFVQITKYLANAASIIDPFVAVYWDVPDFVKQGTYKAYGKTPPSTPAINSNQTEESPYVAALNTNLVSAIPTSGTGVTTLLNQISDSLKTDDLGTSLSLTGGDGPEAYINKLSEWNQNTSLFLTQALGAGVDLMDILIEDIQLKAQEADFEQKTGDLYVKAFTLKYSGPDDPVYIADRNQIISLIDSLILEIGRFETSLSDLATTLESTAFKPAIAVQTSLLSSDTTGKDTITLSPETFTLRAHVRNISTVSVAGLSARLTFISAKNSVTLSTSQELTIGSGTLAADDGVNGSGSDETDVEWKIQYNGDSSAELIFLSVDVLENGSNPTSFITIEAQNILSVDSTLSDKDLDLMPDDWEGVNGLDTTLDDSLKDPDNDGLTNLREYDVGTDPQNSDTDGDGLSDGEEVTGGADGYVTDPLDDDTDGDGVPDGSDGQPLDGGTSEIGEMPDEPVVALDNNEVVLSKDMRVASVKVTNSGTGTLSWTAVSDNDAVAIVSPNAPDLRNGDGTILITAPANYDFSATGMTETTIKVFDVIGATRDYKEITVIAVSDDYAPPDEIDIKANGSDGPVSITQEEGVSVTVSLTPGEIAGDNADYWVYATSPFGTFWYTLDSDWQPSDTPIRVHGGPLFNLPPFTVLDMSLPVGNYTFTFSVDDNMDNIKNDTYSDSVQVTVE